MPYYEHIIFNHAPLLFAGVYRLLDSLTTNYHHDYIFTHVAKLGTKLLYQWLGTGETILYKKRKGCCAKAIYVENTKIQVKYQESIDEQTFENKNLFLTW